MSYDYFYGQSGELFSYYRIPKALFQDSRFRQLSTDAKTLYGILLDRMSLSAKNGWLDEQGRVFIIFTIEDVKRALCCADNKATKLLRELEEFGLIERKRRGLGKPSLVYVKNFSAESSKSIFQNRDFHDSGGFKSASQDPAKSRCNKTDENNTEMSETYPFYSEEENGMSKREQLEEYFSQSLEVDTLLRLCPDDGDTIYQIIDLLVDTCATNRRMEQEKNTLEVLEIAPGQYPKQIVIDNDLKSLQQAVDGPIAASYPFEDPVAIVYNDEGKLMGLPLNRALRDENGQSYDVVAGTFLVVGLGDEDFVSLSPELAQKYEEHFHQPEAFIPLGHRMMVIPVPDEAVQSDTEKATSKPPVEHDR